MLSLEAWLEVDKGQSQRYLHRPINQGGQAAGNGPYQHRRSELKVGGVNPKRSCSNSISACLFKNCRHAGVIVGLSHHIFADRFSRQLSTMVMP